MFYYSKTTNTFYDFGRKENYVAAGTWPKDAKEVAAEVAGEFMASPPPGKIRSAGKNGLPVWKDIPAPTSEQLIIAADIVKQGKIDAANAFINGRQWPGKAAIGGLGDELTQYQLWLDYLDALEAVSTSSAPEIVWPEKPA